jgi:DNA invertase Pin-like site-specific DNA recombinase
METQRDAIERWAAEHGVRIVLFEADPDVSGGTPLEKRAGLQRAIAGLRVHKAGLLLVAKRDRLARDVVVAATVERAVAREGAQLFSVDGIGNGEGPADMLMRTMLDGVAQFEKAIIRKRIKDTLALKASRGECTGGVPPYGMQLASDGKHLEPNPEELETMRRARELAKTGLSYRKIMRALAEAGRFNRRGKIFDLNQIGRMVKGTSIDSPRPTEPVAACARGHVHEQGADAIGAFCKEGACGLEAGKPLSIRRIAWRSVARAS